MNILTKILTISTITVTSMLMLPSLTVNAVKNDFHFDYVSPDLISSDDLDKIYLKAKNSFPNEVVRPEFNCDSNSYGVKMYTLNKGIASYSEGNIEQYIVDSSDYFEYKFYYNNGEFSYNFTANDLGEICEYDYYPKSHNKYHAVAAQKGLLNNFVNNTTKFINSGKVTFVSIPFGSGYDRYRTCGIVSYNDIPKYVVFMLQDTWSGGLSEINDFDSNETIKLKNAANTLINNGQRVFDFDFILELSKADQFILPNNYIYISHGLQSMYKKCNRTINGIRYRFNENGICIGTYTGWTKKEHTDGRKEYRYCKNGIVCTGKWRIKGKIYIFDENGILYR